MNVFYTKTSEWEEDYFKYDIFNQDFYEKKINFIIFDINFKDFKDFKDQTNIIILNAGIHLNFAEKMLQELKPKSIFHLSDECCNQNNYYELYKKYPLDSFFHQYNSSKISYPKNHMQIPLGYVKYFNKSKTTITDLDIKEKEYDFSFIGSVKSDRSTMLNIFKSKFGKNFISLGNTNWRNPSKQKVSPENLNDIYSKSIFIPVGRGNISLDCFRIYEAIVSGSIPVIIGNDVEISETFHYNGFRPELLFAKNWKEGVKKCSEILKDKEKISKTIQDNYNWWKKINKIIIKNIVK